MADNYFTAAQAREAAEKKEWINFCKYVNQFIIKTCEEGKSFVTVRCNSLVEKMKPRMITWLRELGYKVVNDVSTGYFQVEWDYPVSIDEDKYSKYDYSTPLRAVDAKKYSDEHSKKELTLKDILDKVSELADVGIYRHTFPLASFCKHNAIRPATIDKLQKLGYDICLKGDRLEIHWNKINKSEENDKFLLTAWDALLRADAHNFQVVKQTEMVLNVIRDKSTNEGLFEHIAYVSCPETCAKLRELGYKATELQGDKIKIYWGE